MMQGKGPCEFNARAKPNLFVTIVFWLTMGFLYLPLLYLVYQTFLVNPYDWASGLSVQWIVKLFQSGSLWLPLMNSVGIAVVSATIAVMLGTIGAIGLSRRETSLPPVVRAMMFLPILLPEVITGLSLLLFFLFFRVPLGFLTVVLAHASFSASFVYFIMAEQLRKLDPHMEEAAQDLGASAYEIFWKVTFPNILPGITAGWLMAFTLSFDDFLISFFTSGAGLTTLPLKIYSLMRIGMSPELNGLAFLLIVISTCLVCILFAREQSRKWILRA